MSRPDFFIVGAPKSGTTALTTYLAAHPEVAMCKRKELHYFAPDLYRGRTLTEDDYLSLFSVDSATKRVGEASVWYLYSDSAAERIRAFAPHADIIVMLRNPVDMLHSLHSQFSYGALEWVDFETALALDADREAGKVARGFVPRSYRSAGRYTEQLERFVGAFGRDKVHVIIFDDFQADVLREYGRVCEFLEIEAPLVADFPVVNSNKRPRSRALGNFLRKPPAVARQILRAIPHDWRYRMWMTAVNANRIVEPRTPMPAAIRHRLEAEFAEEIERLAALIQRDLSAWLPADRADRHGLPAYSPR